MSSNTENKQRLKIGLLVSHLDEAFDDSVCEGAMVAAEQKDVNLVIFPGRYINGVYDDTLRTEYEYQYNTIFRMPAENKFDVLLVLLGTLGNYLSKEERTEFLKTFDGTPVITIASPIEGYPCIAVDNKTGMKSVVNHLIECHGCRRIGFVSGPKTNADAIERLNVYKDVLESHGIEYDENRVVYGNFSKYSTPQVEQLLDRCTDLQAVVFANDQMASAGYQVMHSRGIKPGTDIFVTGFDNEPISEELMPHLTTVESDASELGYTAVTEAVNYIHNGCIGTDSVPASMICRESCGCQGRSVFAETDEMLSSEEIADKICGFLLDRYRSSDSVIALKEKVRLMIIKTSEAVKNCRNQDPYTDEAFIGLWNQCADQDFFKFVNIYSFYSAMEYHQNMLLRQTEDLSQKETVTKLFIKLFRIVAEKNAAYCSEKLEDAHFLTWQTNAITRDMLVFQAYDDRTYHSVVDKLTRLHMKSSYLYSYDKAVINLKEDKWSLPECIKLKSYHNQSEAVLLPAEEQDIKPDELFSNPYLPTDRRYTMVASALFSNEEHYGLLMCELSHDDFRSIPSVTGQLCAALKIITLMKQQEVIRRQLQQSLIEIKENNQLLSEISKLDELTGCFNRRGFFEEVRKKINECCGKDAIMVFADLDSLKTINDRFGHEDGDFAIRSAAAILKKAFGEKEIVGRIGGDEFALCAFPTEPVSIPQLRERIEEVTAEFNRCCADKPYIIHTSAGAYPFKCTEDVEIGELLSHADELLYEQKHSKKPILKSEMK